MPSKNLLRAGWPEHFPEPLEVQFQFMFATDLKLEKVIITSKIIIEACHDKNKKEKEK